MIVASKFMHVSWGLLCHWPIPRGVSQPWMLHRPEVTYPLFCLTFADIIQL